MFFTVKPDFVIQKSAWGWTLYDVQLIRNGELAAIVASANEPTQLVKYALEKLHGSVHVAADPILFLDNPEG
jgi:hypothetical protein